MKQIILTLIFGLLLTVTSCKESELPTSNAFQSTRSEKPSRIQLVERTVIKNRRYYIIKVDDKEYFVNGDGGMLEITKD